MSLPNFASYSVPSRPGPKQVYDFPPYISVKTEGKAAFVHGEDGNPYRFHSFPVSPHGFSSCMYASSLSPCSQQIISPGANIQMASKENGFRNSPSCRRRLDFNHNAFFDVTKVGPMAVAKRNERERNRVKLINMTFHTLRQHLPHNGGGSKGKSRKLSKVQTLRSAIDYIRQLQELVHARQMLHSSTDSQKNGSTEPADIKPQATFQEHCAVTRRDKDFEEADGYMVCQTSCLGMLPACTLEKLSPASLRHKDNTDSSMTTNSNAASPFSDSSSYDVIQAQEDEDFSDFVDWF